MNEPTERKIGFEYPGQQKPVTSFLTLVYVKAPEMGKIGFEYPVKEAA